jgi:hypothetical protein
MKTQRQKGNITLTLVLFVSVILLLGGITVVIASIDFTQSSKSFYNTTLANIRSQSCLDDGLLRIKNDTSYTGNYSITFSDGSCTGTVVNSGTPNIKSITITGLVNGYSYTKIKKADTSTSPFTLSN